MKVYSGSLVISSLFVTILLIPFFIILGAQGNFTQGNEQISDKSIEYKNQGEPRHLKIPRINVDASVEAVGYTTSGNMAIPNNAMSVGWFRFGPKPGDIGSSVMAGHFDSSNGKAGVFFNLYKLNKGDKLFIEDNSGKTTTFVVQGSRIYESGYAEEVFSSNDGSHLNLVTCDGVWDGVKKSFNKRLVVFSDITN